MNRWHARRAARMRFGATGFVSAPEPRSIGSVARGRQLLAGNFLFAGHLLQTPAADIWELQSPSPEFSQEIQGFAWLDDLAAVGDFAARASAQRWLWDWIARYGRGGGPGWTPDVTGRRLIRWINHALFILRGNDAPDSAPFYLSLQRQAYFLSRRWHVAAPGLPRFEALAGLIYAGLSLEGMAHLARPAIEDLARECAARIDGQGGLPSRNPEELLEVFMLLTWTAEALSDARLNAPVEHVEAIGRIAPTLRMLRQADGGLARFHGGGRGQAGWLDHALAEAGVRKPAQGGLPMGYARLAAGRTTLIIDAAPPPRGPASWNAHASTLAFELTSGRRPMIVNCGSGRAFGPEWRRAGRATASHSTLAIAGYSSARLGERDSETGREDILEAPIHVPVEIGRIDDGTRFQGGHDGFVATHGLIHARTLELGFDGRALAGEDMLLALTEAEKKRFDKAMAAAGPKGIPFAVRFHLHPDVEVTRQDAGASVALTLLSGEQWVFRLDAGAELSLQASVYLSSGRLKPRAANQIVLSGHAVSYATRVRWSLAKTPQTANAVRDLVRDTEDQTD